MSTKWVMNGSRPTSSIAIQIMGSLGSKMDGKGGWTETNAPTKTRRVKKKRK